MRTAILCASVLLVACAAPPAAPVTAPLAVSAAPSRTPEPTPAATATPTPSPEPTPSATPKAAVSLDAGVGPRVAELIKTSRGSAALVVANGASGEILLEERTDETVFAASLYKLGVLLEAEGRIEAGKLRSTDRLTITRADQRDGSDYTPAGTVLTIEQALERMITLSDNPTGLALIRTFGTEAIHRTLLAEGIDGQFFSARGSVTTARAVGTFFGELARGALISAAASARMLARLSRQRVNDRIPAALPAGVVLGHKTGNLGFVTHDAGLIRGPGGTPIVLVVLTWDSSEEKGSQLIRDIAATVYGGLSGP